MSPRPTRRGLLVSIPLFSFGVPTVSATSHTTPEPRSESFDPAIHGFGFRNWAAQASTYPEHDHETVTETQISTTIRTEWNDPFERVLGVSIPDISAGLRQTIAQQIYVSANQLSATNGHCYGIVFTAQAYYERPTSIPEGFGSASEIDHPSVPLSVPDYAPVGEQIDLFQVSQVLNPHSWIGRRAMVRPSWIDVSAQVSNLVAVVDEFGTAGVTLIDSTEGASHQVLVYDYNQMADRTVLEVYDPNTPAAVYERGERRQVVVRSGEMEPYNRYDTLVFNRRDRIIAARGQASAVPAFDRGVDRIRDLLCLVVFLVDSPDVCLSVVDPDGEPVLRDEATFMDRSQTPYHSMRYRYDPPPGDYRLALTATADTDYTITVEAADSDGELLSREITGSLESGETHDYLARLPTTSDEEGTIESVTDTPRWRYAVGGAGGAAAVGMLGYGVYRAYGASSGSTDTEEKAPADDGE